MGKNQWVSPDNGNWKVQSEGSQKPSKKFDHQSDAIKYAKTIAQNQKSELIVQGKNGRIRSKDSYGNDPCPPKDKEH